MRNASTFAFMVSMIRSLLFELRTFIIEPLLLFKKSLLFRLQCLQARQFFIALHGK